MPQRKSVLQAVSGRGPWSEQHPDGSRSELTRVVGWIAWSEIRRRGFETPPKRNRRTRESSSEASARPSTIRHNDVAGRKRCCRRFLRLCARGNGNRKGNHLSDALLIVSWN